MPQTPHSLRRIVITGVESTGKTAMCEHLAQHFNGHLVPEMARIYLNALPPNTPYTPADVLRIAKMQCFLEDTLAATAQQWLFCDTALVVPKIWCQYKYKSVPNWIEQQIQLRPYDVYLLLDINLAWQADPQRENPDVAQRKELMQIYIHTLQALPTPFYIVSGTGAQRFAQARQILYKHFANYP